MDPWCECGQCVFSTACHCSTSPDKLRESTAVWASHLPILKGHGNHVLAHPDQSGNLVTDCAGYVVSVVHVSDILLLQCLVSADPIQCAVNYPGTIQNKEQLWWVGQKKTGHTVGDELTIFLWIFHHSIKWLNKTFLQTVWRWLVWRNPDVLSVIYSEKLRQIEAHCLALFVQEYQMLKAIFTTPWWTAWQGWITSWPLLAISNEHPPQLERYIPRKAWQNPHRHVTRVLMAI